MHQTSWTQARDLPQERAVEPQAEDTTIQIHGHDKYKRTLADVLHRMARMSITRWSKTAGAGGIGDTLQGIENWRG